MIKKINAILIPALASLLAGCAPPPTPVLSQIPKAEEVRATWPPTYSRVSKRAGEQGIVVLKARIDAVGRVEQAEIYRSSGFARLDESALQGARAAAKFDPVIQDGKPVKAWVFIPVKFELHRPKPPP